MEPEVYSRIQEIYNTRVGVFEGGNVVWAGDPTKVIIEKYCNETGLKPDQLQIADLGAGTGPFGPLLLDYFRGSRYAGFDCTQNMVTRARARLANMPEQYQSRAEFVQADFRNPDLPDVARFSGWANVGIAVAAIDGQPSYSKHILDTLFFVKEGGMIMSIDYPNGNQNLGAIEDIERDRKIFPLNLLAATLKRKYEGYTTQSTLNVPWNRLMFDPRTYQMLPLIMDREFRKFDREIPRPSLDQIEVFVGRLREAGTNVDFVNITGTGAPFNPVLVRFNVDERVRTIAEDLAKQGI